MNNTKTLNTKCNFEIPPPIQGMIDSNAYHSSITTWPIPLAYVQINPANKTEPVVFNLKSAVER
jgi:hypothetical protein